MLDSQVTSSESLRYFQAASRVGTHFPQDLLLRGLEGKEITSIFDVGCGEGTFTRTLGNKFSAKVVGVEPNRDVVKSLNEEFVHDDNLTFEFASATSLPYDDRAFDLVVSKGVVPWLKPAEYLYALAEMMRVSRRWLLIVEKFAAVSYKTPYSHVPGRWTYRRESPDLILGAGGWQLLSEVFFVTEGGGFRETTKDEFVPFLGNPANWYGHRSAVMENSEIDFPIHVPEDFEE